MKQAVMNWSSGKDSALALYKILQKQEFQVKKLITTVNSQYQRVSMHGLRENLLKKQAQSLQIPLETIALNGNVSMRDYNRAIRVQNEKLKKEKIEGSIFGDIFLEDLKMYREEQLQGTGILPVFPLWQQDTNKLMQEFLQAGFKAIVVCVNAEKLNKSFCGRIIDEQFLQDLPQEVDPCGENGEFHTFVFNGPIFSQAVSFKKGDIVEKNYTPNNAANENEEDCFQDKKESWDTKFWYCDLKE